MEKIRCVVRTNSILGECPTWCERKQVLYWVDILGNKIHCYHPDNNKNDTFNLPDLVSALALCEDENKLIVTTRKTISLFDMNTQKLTALCDVESNLPDNRLNDMKCDAQGRLWVGTMNDSYFANPDGALYRYASDTGLTKMISDIACSNGTTWSIDNKTLYTTDTCHHVILAFDFDSVTGNICNRRIFSALDSRGKALPDGLTVDAESFIWSVHSGVGTMVRYAPNGKQDKVIQLPVPRTTSCAFGGKDMKTLYVTSARELMTSDEIKASPLSGSLFAIDTDIKGMPSNKIPRSFYESKMSTDSGHIDVH